MKNFRASNQVVHAIEGLRRDYRYWDFESVIVESNADEADTIPLRKRRRTETKELSMVPANMTSSSSKTNNS